MNAEEKKLHKELSKMSEAELEKWMRTPRPFDPNINVGVVILALKP